MKELGIIILILLLMGGMELGAQSNERFLGIGLTGFNRMESLEVNYSGEGIVFGLSGRLKLSENVGVMLDILYMGTRYYYQNEYYDWEGPVYWSDVPYPTEEKEDYEYYHDEFVIFPTIAFFIPLGGLQLYTAAGPALFNYSVSDAYESDYGFSDYYDNLDFEGFSFGMDIKFGLDLFLSKNISLGIEANYIVNSLTEFFKNVDSDSDYLSRESYIGITALVWL